MFRHFINRESNRDTYNKKKTLIYKFFTSLALLCVLSFSLAKMYINLITINFLRLSRDGDNVRVLLTISLQKKCNKKAFSWFLMCVCLFCFSSHPRSRILTLLVPHHANQQTNCVKISSWELFVSDKICEWWC